MTFQSVEYLIFLPIVFLLYWTVCRSSKMRQNVLILTASLVFYAWWDWRCLGLLLVTAFSTFGTGKWLRGMENQKKRKMVLVGALVLNLGILFFFKYFNFFTQALVGSLSLIGVEVQMRTLEILLPVGISFYTFTALSYTIDVFQRKVEATGDVLAYLAYVMFFPSILSGPISRAQKQLPQYLKHRKFNCGLIVSGCKSVLWGGVMKLCLADRLGIYVDSVYGSIAQHNGTTLLLASVLYTIQIYADFAGYSLMAIGSGKLLGIELQTNFIRPYFAQTLTDFWRRWHISLTTWFRDYIYFPLGGSRCSKARWALNILVVFTVSGLWHGAAYTFIIWGAIHGVCMVIERLVYGNRLKNISDGFTMFSPLRLALTFAIVNFAWIFFRVSNLGDVGTIFRKIFTEPGMPFVDANILMMGFAALALVFIFDIVKETKANFHLLSSRYLPIKVLSAALLIVYILGFGVLNGGSFIYFQF